MNKFISTLKLEILNFNELNVFEFVNKKGIPLFDEETKLINLNFMDVGSETIGNIFDYYFNLEG